MESADRELVLKKIGETLRLIAVAFYDRQATDSQLNLKANNCFKDDAAYPPQQNV